MEEIYKDIPDYEGMYRVSNLGNVKSLKFGKEKVLKRCFYSNKRYLMVNLCKDSKREYKSVHSLVAVAFLNHTPDGHNIVVDHIDEDGANNRLENLQLITSRENRVRSIRKGKTSSQYIGVCWNKRLSKWASHIRINGKNKHIGLFTDELEASEAYQKELLTITKNN